MNNRREIDVDAILKEMRGTKDDVAVELLQEGTEPLILQEDDTYSLEELVSELEAEEGIEFGFEI